MRLLPCAFAAILQVVVANAHAQPVTATLTLPNVSGSVVDPTVGSVPFAAPSLSVIGHGDLSQLASPVPASWSFEGPLTVVIPGLPATTVAGSRVGWDFNPAAPIAMVPVPLFKFSWPGEGGPGIVDSVEATVPGLVGYQFQTPFNGSNLAAQTITRDPHFISSYQVTFILTDGRQVHATSLTNSATVTIARDAVPASAANVPALSPAMLGLLVVLLLASPLVVLRKTHAKRKALTARR